MLCADNLLQTRGGWRISALVDTFRLPQSSGRQQRLVMRLCSNGIRLPRASSICHATRSVPVVISTIHGRAGSFPGTALRKVVGRHPGAHGHEAAVHLDEVRIAEKELPSESHHARPCSSVSRRTARRFVRSTIPSPDSTWSSASHPGPTIDRRRRLHSSPPHAPSGGRTARRQSGHDFLRPAVVNRDETPAIIDLERHEMSATPGTGMDHHRLDGPFAWTRRRFEATDRWRFELTAPEIDDIERAIEHRTGRRTQRPGRSPRALPAPRPRGEARLHRR